MAFGRAQDLKNVVAVADAKVISEASQSKTRTVRRIARKMFPSNNNDAVEAVEVETSGADDASTAAVFAPTAVSKTRAFSAAAAETAELLANLACHRDDAEERSRNTTNPHRTTTMDRGDSAPMAQSTLWTGTRSTAMEGFSKLELAARAWEKFAQTVEEEWRNGEGMSSWHARRKENAFSRLSFIEEERSSRGLPTLDWLIDDLETQSCLRCAQGQNAGRICPCSMRMFDERSGFVINGPSTSASSEAGADEEIDQLDVDWFSPPQGLFAPPPGLEVGPSISTAWRHLLHGPPSMVCSQASIVRSQNVAWRRWWEAHHPQGFSGPGPMTRHMGASGVRFQATPTSTSPGTPRLGPQDMADEATFLTTTVNFTVPLHIAPQVHQFIEDLLAQNRLPIDSSKVGGTETARDTPAMFRNT